MANVTIKDIAKIAGMSHPTVSKALNNAPGVNPQTRERILELAKQLHYVPNLAAKRLVHKKNRSIGFIWPPTKSLFFYHLCNSLQQESHKRGIDIIVSMSDPIQALRIFNEHFIDFVVCWFPPEWVPSMEFMTTKDVFQGNVLILGGGRAEKTHCFQINRFKAMYSAVAHLSALGHRNIAFMGGSSHTEKVNGYMQALLDFQLPYSLDQVIIDSSFNYNRDDSSINHDYDTVISLFTKLWNSDHRPTAIITDSQQSSFSLLRIINQVHISVPDDLSLVCYDDIPELKIFGSPVTTCGPTSAQLVESVLNLYESLTEKVELYETKEIIPELIVRNSTRPLQK